MTSANVINYTIFKDGAKVGEHRQHLYCKDRSEDLLRFQPPELYQIQAHGFDEHEAPWEDKPVNLRDYLAKRDLCMPETTEQVAEKLYSVYCAAVGGKAFNGDALPDWKTFRADPAKQAQSDAWVAVAQTAEDL